MKPSKNFPGRVFDRCCDEGVYPGVETPVTPDELDDSTLVLLPKGLWGMAGVGLSGASGWGVVCGVVCR